MMWGSFGLAISMMLIAVLLSFTPARGYSEKLNKATASASVAFFFTYVSFMALDVRQQDTNDVLRCSSSVHQQTVFHGKGTHGIIDLCQANMPQGIRARNSPSSRQSKGHSNRYLLKLALGKLLHPQHHCKISH
jgi:hypothetical protein